MYFDVTTKKNKKRTVTIHNSILSCYIRYKNLSAHILHKEKYYFRQHCSSAVPGTRTSFYLTTSLSLSDEIKKTTTVYELVQIKKYCSQQGAENN